MGVGQGFGGGPRMGKRTLGNLVLLPGQDGPHTLTFLVASLETVLFFFPFQIDLIL